MTYLINSLRVSNIWLNLAAVKNTHPLVLFSFSVLFFLLGLLLLVVLGSKDVIKGIEDHHILIIELQEDAPVDQIDQLLEDISNQDYFIPNLTEYIDPIQAYDRYRNDHSLAPSTLTENPFYPIIVVGVRSDQPIDVATSYIAANTIVEDVFQESSFQDDVSHSFDNLSIALTVLFAIVGMLVIIILIQFIKLSLKEKKRVIRLMQLSGAYNNQIIQPFVIQSLKDAVLSSLIAIVLLILTFLLIGTLTGYSSFVNAFTMVLIATLIVLSAIVISTITTYMIVKLYLRNI